MSNSGDFPIIPVLAAVILRGNTVLIARRKPHLKNGNKWEFPGGKLRNDEGPETGLKREIMEELGVEIAVDRPFHIVNHRDPHQSILLIAYLCRLRSETWRLKDHDEIVWAQLKGLKQYDFSEADLGIVARLIERH